MELREELQDTSKIQDWAWNQCDVDDTPMKKLVRGVEKRGYLTKCELIKVAKWKVPKKRNTFRNVIKNHPNDVKKMTRNAFRATVNDSIYYLDNQRPRRDFGLHGVRVPIGSAILHWFHEAPYPIWDRHAIWSVQLDKSLFLSGSLTDIDDETLITELQGRGYNLDIPQENKTTAEIVKIG